MKKRIWELDALRGVLLLVMIYVHITYDLTELFGVVTLKHSGFYDFARGWTGVAFLLLSGTCVTFGKHPVKRGLTVLAGGICVTLVTAGMAAVGLADPDIRIWFGILHCLGFCMLLWPLLEKLPPVGRLLLGIAIILLGSYLNDRVRIGTDLLLPFGLFSRGFASSDYFPLLPFLGWFLVGSFLGQTVYRRKESLLPEAPGRNLLSRSLSWMGRNSLTIYLAHQPVIYIGIAVILYVKGVSA